MQGTRKIKTSADEHGTQNSPSYGLRHATRKYCLEIVAYLRK